MRPPVSRQKKLPRDKKKKKMCSAPRVPPVLDAIDKLALDIIAEEEVFIGAPIPASRMPVVYKGGPIRDLTMVITHGEEKLVSCVAPLLQLVYPGRCKYVVSTLKTGDVGWVETHKVAEWQRRRDEEAGDDDEAGDLPGTSDHFFMRVERKTVPDLWSSITGDRAEQTDLLVCSAGGPENVAYIIEGELSDIRNPQVHAPLISKLVSLSAKHRVGVSQVSNTAVTALKLVNMHQALERVAENKLTPRNGRQGIAPADTKFYIAPPTSKRALREDKKFVNMLLQVEGVSRDRAESIQAQYPSFSDLFQAYLRTEDPDNMLTDMRHVTGNSERLGPVLSKRIAAYFEVDKIVALARSMSRERTDRTPTTPTTAAVAQPPARKKKTAQKTTQKTTQKTPQKTTRKTTQEPLQPVAVKRRKLCIARRVVVDMDEAGDGEDDDVEDA
jgi:ERCC4-type nuclease